MNIKDFLIDHYIYIIAVIILVIITIIGFLADKKKNEEKKEMVLPNQNPNPNMPNNMNPMNTTIPSSVSPNYINNNQNSPMPNNMNNGFVNQNIRPNPINNQPTPIQSFGQLQTNVTPNNQNGFNSNMNQNINNQGAFQNNFNQNKNSMYTSPAPMPFPNNNINKPVTPLPVTPNASTTPRPIQGTMNTISHQQAPIQSFGQLQSNVTPNNQNGFNSNMNQSNPGMAQTGYNGNQGNFPRY